MQDVMFLKNRVKEHVELVANHFTNHAVFYCGLYGSQNYGLNTDDSDVDTKCMVLPPFRDVVLGRKMVSTDLADPYGALCNVKDVRAMFDNFFKGNVNFVEVLYTEYFSVGVDYLAEAKELRDHRDMVANRDPLKLMEMAAGMARQKYVAFNKPFESKKEVLAKYGYDPKQLHHLGRLAYFMTDYMAAGDFGYALRPDKETNELLMSLKTNPLPLEHAEEKREFYMSYVDKKLEDARQFWGDEYERDLAAKRSVEVRAFLDDLAYRLLCKAYDVG